MNWDVLPEDQTPCNIYQENVHRIEGIEKIFKITKVFAPFMVVEVQKRKGWQSVVLGTEKTELDISGYNIKRILISEKVEDKDKCNAEAVIIAVDQLSHKDSESEHDGG